MKRVFFTLVIFLGLAAMLQAQLEVKPTFGLNSSRLSDDPEGFSQKARIGYQFGGTLQIGKKAYLEPGIFWVKMGSELTGDTLNTSYKTDISAIRIPVFAGYQLIGGDEENLFGLRVFGGPTLSWITKINNDGTNLSKDDFNNLLWGIDAGVGIDIWLVFIDAGYEWGLNQVFKDDPNKAKNKAFWINVGMRFRL